MDAHVDPDTFTAQRRRAAELRDGLERAQHRLRYFERERERLARKRKAFCAEEHTFYRRLVAAEEMARDDVDALSRALNELRQ